MRGKKSFIREKKIYCGKRYLEVDIIPVTELDVSGKRKRKQMVTAPKVKNLNDKRAKRYFVQLLNSNFGERDLHVTVTYAPEFLPGGIEEAQGEVRKYIRRLEYRRRKEGLGAMKYIVVTECVSKEGRPVRIHHHIVMDGGLSREVVEGLWSRNKRKLGYVNADRLQPDERSGLEALGRYLTKGGERAKNQRRWNSSHNLVKPFFVKNDSRYSRRKVERDAKEEMNHPEYWEERYPGYGLVDVRSEYNDDRGWSIYLKMYRRE